MTTNKTMPRVWAIPLAKHGFIPCDTENNPVRWYLENLDTDRVADTMSWATKAEAEEAARKRGWRLEGAGAVHP